MSREWYFPEQMFHVMQFATVICKHLLQSKYPDKNVQMWQKIGLSLLTYSIF